jgi:hypothetical protein
MKKVLIGLLVLIVLVVGAGVYLLSGADDFIKMEIEKQGSKYLDTPVTVANVDLAFSQGRLTLTDLNIANPAGFSQEIAFSLGSVTFDLGGSTSEPYVVDGVIVEAPEILYEVDASSQGNLLVLKNNLTKNLPKGEEKPAEPAEAGANPLIIVEDVTISKVRLKLNFEQLDTGDLEIEKKVYDIELPTFSAGSIGKPNGMPANEVGAAIASQMLDNVLEQAKAEAKKRLEEEAKRRAMEKINEETGKLKEKATEKLKGLFNKKDDS